MERRSAGEKISEASACVEHPFYVHMDAKVVDVSRNSRLYRTIIDGLSPVLKPLFGYRKDERLPEPSHVMIILDGIPSRSNNKRR